jgi:hypothetical protein
MIASCAIVFAWFGGGGSAVFALAGGTMPNPEEDPRTVAALDTEYPAAVKNNSAAVMSRILADDFIGDRAQGRCSPKRICWRKREANDTSGSIKKIPCRRRYAPENRLTGFRNPGPLSGLSVRFAEIVAGYLSER